MSSQQSTKTYECGEGWGGKVVQHTVTLTFHHTSDTVSIHFDNKWDRASYFSDLEWEKIMEAHRELTQT